MKLLLAHPTGNQFFRHLAAGLAEGGRLGRVASCVNFAGLLDSVGRLLPAGVQLELERRAFREWWAAGMCTRPGRELGRLLARRLGWEGACRHETGRFSVDAVYRDFDRWSARQLPRWQREAGLGGVYAYEDGALETLSAARELGMRRVYDLPIAYWETGRRLMAEEAERLPAWAPTLGGGITDSPAKLERKTRELELADTVVSPSQFVVDSLPAWARDSKRFVLAPFGSPVASDEAKFQVPSAKYQVPEVRGQKPNFIGQRSEGGGRRSEIADHPISRAPRPLRVLFVGSMSQRKGLADLFAAIRLLQRPDVELVVMGSLQAPMEFYRGELRDFIYEPGRPHAQVLELMRSCDVLCLPSIVEGRALVMQEAMSQGLPVIITSNTGGEDLIDEGKTGFLVPIRSPGVLAEKLDWLARNRGVLPEMGRAAQRMAATLTWENYGRTILGALGAAG